MTYGERQVDRHAERKMDAYEENLNTGSHRNACRKADQNRFMGFDGEGCAGVSRDAETYGNDNEIYRTVNLAYN